MSSATPDSMTRTGDGRGSAGCALVVAALSLGLPACVEEGGREGSSLPPTARAEAELYAEVAQALQGGLEPVAESAGEDPSAGTGGDAGDAGAETGGPADDGAPGSGDASVVAAVLVDGEGAYWLHGVRYLSHDPGVTHEVDEATQLCRQVARFALEHYLPAVTLETNGLGRFLPALLRRELDRLGYACAVVEHVSSRSKDQRILDAFDPLLAAGALHAHAGVWASGLIEEMREWSPIGQNRDDGLDAVSGCLLTQPVRIPMAMPGGRRPSWRELRPATAVTAFDV